MNEKKVSIVIPTRDCALNLRNCLQSITKQIYPNIETIVVDCNSADDTKKVAKEFTDFVFNFEQQGDHRSAQRNYGVKKSRGEYVLIIDSDMELSPEVVSECAAALDKDASVGAVKIPEESFGRGFWSQCKCLEKSFYQGVDWMEGARFFRKGIYLQAGGYDDALTSGEDWDLSQRVGNLGAIINAKSKIFHNEGQISLLKTMKKKYYYSSKFAKYMDKNPRDKNVMLQTSVAGRYKLFFSNPKKLFKKPFVGIGMLLMKACEFGCGGIGYLLNKKYGK